MTTKNPLPSGILASDIKHPGYSNAACNSVSKVPYDDRTFDLWYVKSFGWVIPTLLISSGRRSNTTDRTYATTLDGKPVRVGRGPHVLETHTVWVRNARLKSLQKFLDLRKSGQATAGQIRDRISSRRAQGQMMRAEGRSSWRWDV